MGETDRKTADNTSSASLPDSSTNVVAAKLTNEHRILRRGDLARIIGLNGKLNDHHKGDLVRVVRSFPIEAERSELNQTGHAFLYDVELVLGGKLNGVPRFELHYTTAQAEGMTGDSRQRRKRKPTLLQDEKNETKKSETTSSSAKKKKVNASSGKTKTKTAKYSNNKKRGPKTVGNANGKKRSKHSKPTSTTSETTKATIISPTNTGNGLGMFERHRREFERCLLRLQKLDVYNFFSDDDVPQEFDERYKSESDTIYDNTLAGKIETESDDVSVSHETSIFPSNPLEQSTSSTRESENDRKKVTDNIEFPNHPPYNFVVLRKRLEHGRYILDRQSLEESVENFHSDGSKITPKSGKRKRSLSSSIQHPIGIDWDKFRDDVIGMCSTAVKRNAGNFDDGTPGTLSNTADKIKTTMEQIYEKTGRRQSNEMELSNDAHRFTRVFQSVENKEAALQGKSWRKKAFPEREYERLKTDAVCAGLSELDERIASYELQTSLKDSFLGLSYTYNDTGQSEGWMKTMVSEGDDKSELEKTAMALSSDDGVIKAQVAASMQSLLIAVQDRVMTENGVLEQNELRSANWECGIEKVGEQVVATNHFDSDGSKPEIVEQPVWGIDCYTRKNISICLGSKFDDDTVLIFIEKWLLPAINACPVDLAYNLSNAARILEGLPLDVESSLNQRKGTTTEQWSKTLLGRALLKKIKETAPPWLHCAARILRKAICSMGHDFFRVHPKGHGSIVLSPKIEPNRLVTFYRGEVYPSWRWGEKMDAISLIQKRNSLKPRLPDFYNMALERPQMDPRGYGLLFVDASRKSGYGSMLSHSCNPSCEVRVAAVNGKLTLAMTTLRELTIGDEVTFDYNAVTESLHEYQAAVCLCGQVQCRGSFLHFATADCYQQVLNRNSPIAVRLSQLIKGSTKKVMSDDDVAILKRHGFQTAAFGAVSVNRRKVTNSGFVNTSLDSMDFVPIWLRTHVADILRYIEYERRALPIALISNQITRNRDESESETDDKKRDSNATGANESSLPDTTNKSVDDKPVKGSKPEPSFFYFLRTKRESYVSLLVEQNKDGSMTGGEIEREIKKMASAEWKSFGDKMKQHWKEKAIAEWQKNGGKEKARLEQQRLKRLSQSKNVKEPKNFSEEQKSTNLKTQEFSESDKELRMKKISFQAADAEGVSAMEQRIQQATQALSRVGRVLDRHREELLRKQKIGCQMKSPAELRELAHSPLAILPDNDVVAWMWNHENGIVRTLLRMTEKEVCVSPEIRLALKQTRSKYSSLVAFGTPWEERINIALPMSPTKGRQLLDEALMEFRGILLDGIRDMATDIKNLRASAREEEKKRRDEAGRREEDAEKISQISTSSCRADIRYAIKSILNGIIYKIEDSDSDIESDNMEITKPWLNNYNKRFKMEKAADLLLIYRRTSTFFRLVPYESLQSTPIEVYAREVGNFVPRSVIDSQEKIQMAQERSLNGDAQCVNTGDENNFKVKSSKDSKKTCLCEPEDIISHVVVDYQGDYVLSQLLQWYNAGIGQKPGLPDMLGCALLPSMAGCWTIDPTKGSNSATGIRTKYQSNIRPKLVEWFKDPFKRGSPWTDEIRRGFVTKDDHLIKDASKLWLPIGSPVLDFLVTGDDHNLMDVLSHLGTDSTALQTNQSDNLLSSVDHGRPAQAVSNWVQCENAECQKWRKIPWHVDIDMLSKKFVCSDHVWGLNPPSCDAPEDDWDETTDARVEADGSVKPNGMNNKLPAKESIEDNPVISTSCNSFDFKIGSRFDVLRPGKEKWFMANVKEIASKKILFHFVKTQAKNDVWLEKSSTRIAPLHTHTKEPQSQSKSQLSRVVISGDIQDTSKKASELARLKMKNLKTKKILEKTGDSVSLSSCSNQESETLSTNRNRNEKHEVKVRIEDEEESDGMSYYDMDDDESGDETGPRDNYDDAEHEAEGYECSGEDEKSPTVTDVSSSDDSLKRDSGTNHVDNSDGEKECTKKADQSDSRFKIPKKKSIEQTSDVIPKKAIPKKLQSSLASGKSLISDAARQAMLQNCREKRPTTHTKRPISLNLSPSKGIRQTDGKKSSMVDHDSPRLKRKASYHRISSQNHQNRSPAKIGSQLTESPFKSNTYRQAILSPKRSFNDKYSIEQRRERELYRDSQEYTARRESYHDFGNRDHSKRTYSPRRSLNDRCASDQRSEREIYRDPHTRREHFRYQDSSRSSDNASRLFEDQEDMHARTSDNRRGRDNSVGRGYDDHTEREQYEVDRRFSSDYDRSHYEDSHPRYREKSNENKSRSIPSNGIYESDQSINRIQNSRRMNINDEYHGDYRSFDGYGSRNDEEQYIHNSVIHEKAPSPRARGLNERDTERDSHFHNEQTYPSRHDREFYRDDERHSSRRRRNSGSRREKKRRRKFDGSDEYSRRLGRYNHTQRRDYFDEAGGRENYNR